MKLFKLSLLFTICSAKGAQELDGATFYGDVVDSVSKEVLGDRAWFIDLYSPWCKHCKALAPTWDELADKHEGSMNVVKVDCSKFANNNICNMFGVSNLPTLVYLPVRSNEFHMYNGKGERKMNDLEYFAV